MKTFLRYIAFIPLCLLLSFLLQKGLLAIISQLYVLSMLWQIIILLIIGMSVIIPFQFIGFGSRYFTLISPNDYFGVWSLNIIITLHGLYMIYGIWQIDKSRYSSFTLAAIIHSLIILLLIVSIMVGSISSKKEY